MRSGPDEREQDSLLHDRLAGDLFERSDFHRKRLARAGLKRNAIRVRSDLVDLPTLGLDDVSSIAALSLWDHNAGRRKPRRYRPLRWSSPGTVPLGYSKVDLESLAELGRRGYQMAGVGRNDLVADLVGPEHTREHVMSVAGALRAGVSVVTPGATARADDIDTFDPTVVVGCSRDVNGILDDRFEAGSILTRLHTVIVTDHQVEGPEYLQLAERLGPRSISVLRWWAPAGVLGLWTQCRNGQGMHTHPDVEVLELVDPVSGLPTRPGSPGSIVWTGIGWYASAVVRLRTGADAELHDGRCEACGRHTQRVVPVDVSPSFIHFLDAHPNVVDWAGELHAGPNGDELAVWMVAADPAQCLATIADLDMRVGPLQVTIATQDALDARLMSTMGQRFVDRRAFREDAEAVQSGVAVGRVPRRRSRREREE